MPVTKRRRYRALLRRGVDTDACYEEASISLPEGVKASSPKGKSAASPEGVKASSPKGKLVAIPKGEALF